MPTPPFAMSALSAPGASREIRITMSAETASTLQQSGYSLYGLKAIETPVLDAEPLVWYRIQTYSTTTILKWAEEYQAYVRLQGAAGSVKVDAYTSYDIALGQVLEVLQAAGTGVVRTGGEPDAISIVNQTTTPFASGLAMRGTGESTPAFFCEIPLHGGAMNVVKPLAQVLLFFSSARIAEGVEIMSTSGPGILIDFGAEAQRAVAFDINAGWSWSQATWGEAVPTGTAVAPLLVVGPP